MTRILTRLFAPPGACGPLCRAVQDEVASLHRARMLDGLPACKRLP